MKSVKILSVSKEGTFISVMKELTDDNNNVTINQHFIPEDAFEWRAAEFGIMDKDELIDMVLYEPYLDNSSQLYDFDDKAKALTAHRNKIGTAKNKLKPGGTNDSAHYTSIKNNMVFDLGAIEVKAEKVDRIFELKNRAVQAIVQAPNIVTRVDNLRQMLSQPNVHGG